MRHPGAPCLAVALLAAPCHAAVYVDDPLTAATFAGRGSRGGGFSANGWTTADEPDAVWYEIADALPAARIEYTVTGLSVGGSLNGGQHDILTVYQAPTGTAEPIPYSPYFRDNDFKVFLRTFGSNEPGRGGATKLEVAFCPRGDPWYHDTACPAGCGAAGLAYANGMIQDIGWDASAAYRMALEWGAGRMTFYRDGVALGSVDYPGDYAPQPLRVRLGSPRHDGVYPGEAFMPRGITIRDVLITGTPAAPTAVCGATSPPEDAGVGSVDAGGGTAVVETLAVLADVTAASWEAGVFPDVNDLQVEGDAPGAPGAVVYLRFPAPSGPVGRATLRVHASSSPSAAGGSGVVCAVADGSWSETTLTWATRPATGACAGAPTSVDPDTDVLWDVTPLFAAGGAGGGPSLAIVSQDPNGAHFLSKEASGAANGPRLIVEITPVTDAGMVAGPDNPDGQATDAAPPADAPDVVQGCSCRTGGRASPPIAGLISAGLLLLRRRRPG